MFTTRVMINTRMKPWPREQYRTPEEVAAPVVVKLLWQGHPYLNAGEIPVIEKLLWQGDLFITEDVIADGHVERVLWQGNPGRVQT